jgi:hypothetical protein
MGPVCSIVGNIAGGDGMVDIPDLAALVDSWLWPEK